MESKAPDDDPPGQARALIEQRMPFRSLAELERRTGIEDISQKLDSAARSGRLPKFDLLLALCDATDIRMGELIVACTVDAGYPDLLPPVTEDDVATMGSYLRSTPEVKALVKAFLEWLGTFNR
jgi:hypothetical protein